MTKLRLLKLLSISSNHLNLDEIAYITFIDRQEIVDALIELQDEDYVFLKNGWYWASECGKKYIDSY